MLDSGVHFYETYQTSDNLYMSVGCIEPQFYETFLEKLGVSDDDLPQFDDFDELKTKVAEIFKTKTRDEWCKVFSYQKTEIVLCPRTSRILTRFISKQNSIINKLLSLSKYESGDN